MPVVVAFERAADRYTLIWNGPDQLRVFSLPLGRSPYPTSTNDRSTASGDFDGDRYADLAVWLEGRKRDRHGVHILYGSPTGLDVARATFRAFPQRNANPRLASGNFGRGKYADLAVGDVRFHLGKDEVGAVHIFYGAKDGLASDLQTWTQNTPGVLGTAEHYKSFGESLVADNFAGTAFDDLAIGVTGEGSTDEGDMPGAVQVLYGSADGLTARQSALEPGHARPAHPSLHHLRIWEHPGGWSLRRTEVRRFGHRQS